MTHENDFLLSSCSARLKDVNSQATIGSGILYHHPSLKDKVYVITAAHNLYLDSDSFQVPRQALTVEFWSQESGQYQAIEKAINHKLVLADADKDLGILQFEKSEVETLLKTIPQIPVVRERHNATQFVVKGFPNATAGLELATINPIWLQSMHEVEKFQLQLNENYSSWATEGFSGSGVFIHDKGHLFLFGIFARYRAEEKGKVIYCQFVHTANEILEANFLPTIPFTFYGSYGLTPIFFQQQIEIAIKNLGPRYNQKLNFRLPVSLLFNDLAKDSVFKVRLEIAFDKWLTAKDYAYGIQQPESIADIEKVFFEIKESGRAWLLAIGWDAWRMIEIVPILNMISKLNREIEDKIGSLYELQRKKEKEEPRKEIDYNYRPPFDSEINRMREIRSVNNDFLAALDAISIPLSNNPCLILQGEAGCGKSHLLGDVATERNKSGKPTLLLLGQLFKNGQTAWQNTLGQLSLSCSKEEFLTSLNAIGKQIGSRVLVLIDALNEGAGKEIWPDELAGYIQDFKNYPFVGLALTVRSTYFQIVVPKQIRDNKSSTLRTHEGFKGNEYAALRLFTEYYGLEQANFPILAPEFSNPLFLQLICQAVKDTGLTKFPQGFQGISALFSRYLKAIINNLVRRKEEYRRREHIIESAVYKMAEACFEGEYSRTIPLQEAIELFDRHFPAYRHLLDDLLLENVFIQSVIHDYKNDRDIEVVYFAYERLGDYYMADQLLKFYSMPNEVKEAFLPHNKLGQIIKEAIWSNRGVIEILSVLLPERFQLEIIEVYDWVLGKKHKELPSNIVEWLNTFLFDSLKWRTTESIDDDKLTQWLKKGIISIDDHAWFNTLMEVTAQPKHPFNSDRLHRILIKNRMPKRDAVWLPFIRYYSTSDDVGNGYPLRRLIDWAWQKDISAGIDRETARLAGQTLTWVLSTTDIALRDETTKALVNLLEEQPEALIDVLISFGKIDDYYILERLYAVAYGCSLRTSKEIALLLIAQYVYNTIFKTGQPPRHILLRDYAKNIVEYAVYRGVKVKGDLSLVRPPYPSPMPTNIPSPEEMDSFELSRDVPGFKDTDGHYHNQIKFSVMSWDFGRYTIDGAFRDFSAVSFTSEEEYKSFLKGLSRNKRNAVKLFRYFKENDALFQEKKKMLTYNKEEQLYNDIVTGSARQPEQWRRAIETLLTADEYNFFREKIEPNIETLNPDKSQSFRQFDTELIKRWIVQRVFELGYDAKLHGTYERNISNYNDQMGNKIERIGKKYQWIALFEAVAMVADNYKVKEERWSKKSKLRIYPGPWHSYLRDIDPAFTTKRKDEETDFGDNVLMPEPETQWWMDKQYNYWGMPASDWVNTIDDLPNPAAVILKKDCSENEWVYLNASIHWKEPKPLGQDPYKSARKEVWYLIQGCLVRKRDKQKTVKWLTGKNFWGRWMPESHRANSSLINRENYWSEASKENGAENWTALEGSNIKVMVTTTEAVGEMSQDKSGAHFRYDMPCKLLFEGMKLQYGKEDGTFVNSEGETVALSHYKGGILMRKDYLIHFLDENNLDIVWTILGEKNALGGGFGDHGVDYFKVINGVYTTNANTISGNLMLGNRE
jgi:hypothetical protein